jgi:hypothetical protein
MDQVTNFQRSVMAITKYMCKLFSSAGATVLRRLGADLFGVVEAQELAYVLGKYSLVRECVESIDPERARDWQRLIGYRGACMRRTKHQRLQKTGVRKAWRTIFYPIEPEPLERKLRDSSRAIEPLLRLYASRQGSSNKREIQRTLNRWETLRTCTVVSLILCLVPSLMNVLFYELRLWQTNLVVQNLTLIAFCFSLVFCGCSVVAKGTYRDYCIQLLSEVVLSYDAMRRSKKQQRKWNGK